VGGAFANHGVLALGAGSTLEAPAFSQSAGAVLRPSVTAAGAGTIAASGAATLGGRLDTPAPATVAGDVTVLTASSVSGAFASVSGGYGAVVGAADVKLRPLAGLQRAVGVPAPLAMPDLAAALPKAAPPPARARRCRTARSWRLRWGWSSVRGAWRPCRARTG